MHYYYKNDLKRMGNSEFENAKANGTLVTAKKYLPFIPASLKRIIAKSLKPNPTERYESALEMRRNIWKS